MPAANFPTDLRARFSGQKLTPIYNRAVELYEALRVHADGEIPIKLIKKARPNESDAVQEYRMSIYESETQNPVERVLGILEKIRRSPDWMIRFENDTPAIVNKEETLEKYLTEKYPVYNHIEDWLFQEVLRNLALDANSIIVVMPRILSIAPNEYMEPGAVIYNSRNVLDYVPEQSVTVKSDEGSSLLSGDEQGRRAAAAATIKPEGFVPGQVYYYIDTQAYYKFEENSNGDYQLTARLPHGLDRLPAFQMPGKFISRSSNSILKKSLLYAMVPHLNKAARESNDLDAGVIMHLYPEKWRINNIPCPKCNGTAKEQTPAGVIPCRECKGTGMANGRSPFNEVVIRPSSLGDATIPTPPLGYVEKDTKIIELQNERIGQHIFKALSSVNMEHLAEAQLNQSGLAKQYDRDEVNNLIYAFAGDLVTVLQGVIYFINELRYRGIIPADEQRRAMLPIIPVPEKFDIINTTFLLGEYQVGKTAGLSNIILAEMQKEISQKKFYSNPKVADFVRSVMDCDPFPSNTVEEKALMQGQGLAAKEDVILSYYISDFVRQAMEEDKNFNRLKAADKRAVLLEMAKKKLDELNTAKQLSLDIFQQAAGGSGQQQQQQQKKQDPNIAA